MDIIALNLFVTPFLLTFFAVRKLFYKKLAFRTWKFVWMIVTLKLLIPTEVTDGITTRYRSRLNANSMIEYVVNDSLNSWKVGEILSVAWFVGVIILLIAFLINQYKFYKTIRVAIPSDKYQHVLSEFLRERNIKYNENIKVFTSDRLAVPISCGIIKPKIVLPCYIVENMEITSVQYVLAHEYRHSIARDVLYKLLFIVALCIYWINPLMWLAKKYVNIDMESACDEAVIAYNNQRSDRVRYAKTLIDVTEHFSDFLMIETAFGSKNSEQALKTRIKNILTNNRPKAKALSLAVIMVFICMALFCGYKTGNGFISHTIYHEDDSLSFDLPSSCDVIEELGNQSEPVWGVWKGNKKFGEICFISANNNGGITKREVKEVIINGLKGKATNWAGGDSKFCDFELMTWGDDGKESSHYYKALKGGYILDLHIEDKTMSLTECFHMFDSLQENKK